MRAVTSRLDAERIALREALGFGPPHYPLSDHYTSDRWMYGDAHKKLVDSGDWREKVDLHRHRYMTEDVVFGVAFLASVARWAKQPAPVAEAMLAIGGAILGRDLAKGERTLEALGLSAFPGRSSSPAMRIACIGAGRMGRGIALAFARAGYDVVVVDFKPRDDWKALKKEAMAEMEAALAMLAELGAGSPGALPRIRMVPYAEARFCPKPS